MLIDKIVNLYNRKLQKDKILKETALWAVAAFVVSCVLSVFLYAKGFETHPIEHVFYYFFILFIVFCVLNPFSSLYLLRFDKTRFSFVATTVVIIGVCVLCTLPMGLNPVWNGEKPGHRNQYEELASALLEGHLDVHRDADVSALTAMENPYDINARKAAKVSYYWDHAFYKGHYYVYFGVVPAVIVFAPYKALTGTDLITWKGTALFAIFTVLAIFMLGRQIIRKMKASVPLLIYLTLCSCISISSLWYAVKYPAMYCTAIVSGICFAIWSFYLFFKTLFVDDSPSILKITLGALCGALVFGCRPPIGLTEIALLPLIYAYVKRSVAKNNKAELKKLARQAAAFILPYVIIACLLMAYNYARFENPFEFGQSYQLTVTDQTSYAKGLLDRLSLADWINYAGTYFLTFIPIDGPFPWVTQKSGLLLVMPVFLLAFQRWALKDKYKTLRWFHIMLLVGIALLIEAQVLNAPNAGVRYRMDFSFLLGIAVLFKVFCEYQDVPDAGTPHKTYSLWIVYLCFFTMFVAFLLFFAKGDSSLVESNVNRANRLIYFFTLNKMF